MADSAMPQDAKRNVLTKECLRRLRNTKQKLGPEVQNEHLSEFMRRMKKSGYSENYRLQIVKSAKEAYKKILIEDAEGSKPLYRSRNWKNAGKTQIKIG